MDTEDPRRASRPGVRENSDSNADFCFRRQQPIAGFRLGADDYIIKPVKVPLVVARESGVPDAANFRHATLLHDRLRLSEAFSADFASAIRAKLRS